MSEINLLKNYPQSKRNLDERAALKTEDDRKIARKFGKEFFDGDRSHGYGGFYYNPRFWTRVVQDIQDYYGLMEGSAVLDVGCAKGFLLHDFKNLVPGIKLKGIDISEYAIQSAQTSVSDVVSVANAKELPFEDNSFDLVISINTIHNLEIDECKQALREVQRVSRRDAFITVDAFRTEDEKIRMDQWNLTAKSYFHVDEWIGIFKEVGYTGDYYWFIP